MVVQGCLSLLQRYMGLERAATRLDTLPTHGSGRLYGPPVSPYSA